MVPRGGGREEAAPVSCWRTLFVANEWNELQTLRLTSPAFSLFLLVSLSEHDYQQRTSPVSPDVVLAAERKHQAHAALFLLEHMQTPSTGADLVVWLVASNQDQGADAAPDLASLLSVTDGVHVVYLYCLICLWVLMLSLLVLPVPASCGI